MMKLGYLSFKIILFTFLELNNIYQNYIVTSINMANSTNFVILSFPLITMAGKVSIKPLYYATIFSNTCCVAKSTRSLTSSIGRKLCIRC